MDCAASCINPPYPTPEAPFEIIQLNGYSFIAGAAILGLGVTTLVTFVLFQRFRLRNRHESKGGVRDRLDGKIGQYERTERIITGGQPKDKIEEKQPGDKLEETQHKDKLEGKQPKDKLDGKENIIHIKLEEFFRWLGIIMSTHSVIVLFLSSWVILGLGYGALSLRVTVNPVEIWASPNSRSRVEKDFFDREFAPFYRTEQIFIKAKGLPEVCSICVFLK